MINEQFEADIRLIPGSYSKLSVIEENGEKYLKGDIDIEDSSGKKWDTYSIEIKGSENYPFCFPKLFETGNAFPKIMDWHVYEYDDQSCCVDVPTNEKIICLKGLKVIDYIKQYVIPYFANQSFRKKEGYYLYGEYAHGVFGRLEYYQSKLHAKNPTQLIQMFDLILKGYNPDRREYCPFCHKSKFRKCHRAVFMEFKNIQEFIFYDYPKLRNLFLANPGYELPKV
jgi:hypothetical protein